MLAITAFVACGRDEHAPPAEQARQSPSGVPYPKNLSHIVAYGQAQPWLSGETLTEEAWVHTPVDSDADGTLDRIHVRIVRPAETERGLRTPVIVVASPYNAPFYQTESHIVYTHLDGTPYPGLPHSYLASTDPWIALSRQWIPAPYPLSKAKLALAARRWLEPYFIQRGFTIVYADSLGTAGSDGCPTILTRAEAVAMAAVIEWLGGTTHATDAHGHARSAPWSTGHVGMYGVSYDGTLPRMVASLGTRGLDAIVSIAGLSDMYGYYRSGGLVRAPRYYQGEDVDQYMLALTAHPQRCLPLIKQARIDQDRASGDDSPFWAARRLTTDQHRAPAMIAQGQADDNVKTDQSTAFYQALHKRGVPVQLWLHQSGHTDPRRLAVMADAWTSAVNKWFTRYLLGVENGVTEDPGVVLERPGTNLLLREAVWPAQKAATTTYWAAGDGKSGGRLETTLSQTAHQITFTDDARVSAEWLAEIPNSIRQKALQDADFDLEAGKPNPNNIIEAQLRAAENPASASSAAPHAHRARYDSTGLAHSMRISGTPSAQVRLAFSKVANVTALLVDRAPDGNTTIISRAWMDPRNRTSLSYSKSVEEGVFYDLPLTFMPRDYIVRAQHKIGLVVLSSDFDFTLRPPPGTELTLDPAGTSLTLPLLLANE